MNPKTEEILPKKECFLNSIDSTACFFEIRPWKETYSSPPSLNFYTPFTRNAHLSHSITIQNTFAMFAMVIILLSVLLIAELVWEWRDAMR